MSDRVVDPTRQGITITKQDEPIPDLIFQAVPISLEKAVAMVDAWGPGFGFQLHEIARALRRGYEAERALRLHNSDNLRDLDEANDEMIARLGNLRRENDELRRLSDERADIIKILQGHTDALIEKLEQAEGERVLLTQEADQYLATMEKLDYQSRMMGFAFADKPDGYGSKPEHYPLSRVLDLMDAWRPEVERWGLHQMCRRLREVLDAVQIERNQAAEERDDLRRTFDLRWDADMRAIKRWQEAHPGNDLVWPDHADMVVWLLAEGVVMRRRPLAAIPCARVKPDGVGLDCTCPDYRYAPCCNLRVALWPGEPFHTDYLADSGEIHLFAPTVGREPLASAGCVKLVEPEEDDSFLCVPVTEEAYAAERAKVDTLCDAVFGPLVEPAEYEYSQSALDELNGRKPTALGLYESPKVMVEPTIYERNETLDWDFKHRYLG